MWPFSRRRSSRTNPADAGPVPGLESRGQAVDETPTPVRPAWQSTAEFTGVTAPLTPVMDTPKFTAQLTSWQSPEQLKPLGHYVSADAPAGSVRAATSPRETRSFGSRPPAQRIPIEQSFASAPDQQPASAWPAPASPVELPAPRPSTPDVGARGVVQLSVSEVSAPRQRSPVAEQSVPAVERPLNADEQALVASHTVAPRRSDIDIEQEIPIEVPPQFSTDDVTGEDRSNVEQVAGLGRPVVQRRADRVAQRQANPVAEQPADPPATQVPDLAQARTVQRRPGLGAPLNRQQAVESETFRPVGPMEQETAPTPEASESAASGSGSGSESVSRTADGPNAFLVQPRAVEHQTGAPNDATNASVEPESPHAPTLSSFGDIETEDSFVEVGANSEIVSGATADSHESESEASAFASGIQRLSTDQSRWTGDRMARQTARPGEHGSSGGEDPPRVAQLSAAPRTQPTAEPLPTDTDTPSSRAAQRSVRPSPTAPDVEASAQAPLVGGPPVRSQSPDANLGIGPTSAPSIHRALTPIQTQSNERPSWDDSPTNDIASRPNLVNATATLPEFGGPTAIHIPSTSLARTAPAGVLQRKLAPLVGQTFASAQRSVGSSPGSGIDSGGRTEGAVDQRVSSAEPVGSPGLATSTVMRSAAHFPTTPHSAAPRPTIIADSPSTAEFQPIDAQRTIEPEAVAVQREPDVSVAEPPGPAATAAESASTAPEDPEASAPAVDLTSLSSAELDEFAQRLYGRVRLHLRRELRADREREGSWVRTSR